MRDRILEMVKKQFEKDYNCTGEDFNSRTTTITNLKSIKGSRVYSKEEEILKILIFNGKAIISTQKMLKDWCKSYLSKIPPEWMFLSSVLRRIDHKLNEYGYEIDDAHHFYLPKNNFIKSIDNTNLKWYEKEDIQQFRGDSRFDEAFAFNDLFIDILAVASFDEKGNINGMAGATEDSDLMWQIGINVFPGSEGKGIGTKLVTLLKDEIIRRGKVPFYGTAESHMISQKVAIASGFEPSFAELKVKRKYK